MANYDYVIVGPGPSKSDVSAAIRDGLAVTETARSLLPVGDDLGQLRVRDSASRPSAVVVLVYHGGSEAARDKLARQVYDVLVDRTDWDLTLESDDADDALATRIKTTA